MAVVPNLIEVEALLGYACLNYDMFITPEFHENTYENYSYLCDYCGTEYKDNNVNCRNCGAPINKKN